MNSLKLKIDMPYFTRKLDHLPTYYNIDRGLRSYIFSKLSPNGSFEDWIFLKERIMLKIGKTSP